MAQGFFEDLERLAKGDINKDDVTAFLGNPENRHLTTRNTMTNEEGEIVFVNDEARNQYAARMVRSNA
jgi:hypothetical protein